MARSVTKDAELIIAARKRYESVTSQDSHNRLEALEDVRFVYNIDEGQWPVNVRTERTRDGRPCLTSNKLRKFVGIVANQAITERPAIGVSPVDDASDPEIAKVYENLIRMIEYQSNAPVIYQQALTHTVAGGFGFWRILTRYCDDGFDQEIYLEGIEDPFSAFVDPDREFGFVMNTMPRETFKLRYPGKQEVSFDHRGDTQSDKIYVAEHFWKEPYVRELAQVRDAQGQVYVIAIEGKVTLELLMTQGYEVLRTRKAPSHKVKWATLTGAEVLEEREWAGKDIPIIEVCGDKLQVEGKWYKRSLIRDAKDPQRMYNYWLTAQTEAIALTPKAPFLVTPDEIRGHEAMWNSANVSNRPYLFFNKSGGRVPQRERPPEVQTGSMNMMKIADQDIKDVIGIFEAGLGEVSNERSGRAIKLRQSRSDLGTGHFHENFRHALILTGKQLIDLIPKIYDTARVLRVQGEGGDILSIPINQTVLDPRTGEPVLINDLSVGRYDVNASVRVFQTRREEASEMMIQALQYAPSVAPYLLDLVFKYADWPGADEVGKRLQSLMQQGMGQPTPQPPAAPSAALPSSTTTPGGM